MAITGMSTALWLGAFLSFGAAGISTAAAVDRFYVLAFDDVNPALEASYARCVDWRLAELASRPGFVSGQRFAFNDVQMFGGVSVRLPKFLTLIETSAEDRATVAKEYEAHWSPACAGTKPEAAVRYVYRLSGAPQRREAPDTKIPAGNTPRQAYAQIVFTVPNEAVKDRFESWYATCHMPEILRRTGLISGQRGIDGIGKGPVPPTDTIGVYRIELPKGMTIADTRPAVREPGAKDCQIGLMMNGDLSRGYSYRATGPIVGPKS
ncbi:hypothetical protein BJ928_1373 [Rhizobium sp. WW_1]|nr:hypothetical protein BJ928_1373 [Rhizobium sp. WW_1]